MGMYLLQAPAYTAWDNDGTPLSGGLLYTFLTGTTTPAPTYQDQQGTVLQTNPVVMNAAGRAIIFIPDASVIVYRMRLERADGTLVYQQEGVSVPAQPAIPVTPSVPVGTLLAFGGTTAPTGYLLCDGASVSKVTYAGLYAAILDTFGVFDPTTFKVPDLRQRFPLGLAVSGTGATLGATGGTIDHTHTGPSHTHAIADHTHPIPHTHPVPRDGWGSELNSNPGPPAVVTGRINVGNSAGAGSLATAYQPTGNNTTDAANPAVSGVASLTTQAAGTGVTGPANPPFVTVQWVIKW